MVVTVVRDRARIAVRAKLGRMNFSVWSEFTPEAGERLQILRKAECKRKPEAYESFRFETTGRWCLSGGDVTT
jgi:hypothetical protein